MTDMPGVSECRFERVRIVVISILSQEYPTLFLTIVSEVPVENIGRDIELGEYSEPEIEFGQSGPKVEGDEKAMQIRQVPLDVDVGQQSPHATVAPREANPDGLAIREMRVEVGQDSLGDRIWDGRLPPWPQCPAVRLTTS